MTAKMVGARVRTVAGPIHGMTLVLLLGPALLGGCLQAGTRGGEPPDEVQVGSPPTWDNGMKELMALKCAVCHQVPLPKSAPNETSTDYDLRFQHATKGGEGEAAGAADVLGDLQDAVREGLMPPQFATPLTDAETQSILDWDGS
jgi:mono/diheme cytochrome c family protein